MRSVNVCGEQVVQHRLGEFLFSKIGKAGWYEVGHEAWELWRWDWRGSNRRPPTTGKLDRTFFGPESDLPRTHYPVLLYYNLDPALYPTMWERLLDG